MNKLIVPVKPVKVSLEVSTEVKQAKVKVGINPEPKLPNTKSEATPKRKSVKVKTEAVPEGKLTDSKSELDLEPEPTNIKLEVGPKRKSGKVKTEAGSKRKLMDAKSELGLESEPTNIKSEASPKRKSVKVKAEGSPERKPRAPSKKRQGSKKVISKPPVVNFRHRLIWISLELLGLAIMAVSAIVVMLGYSANWFSGTRFFTSLLPFAIGILLLIVVVTGLLIGWWKLRKWLHGRALLLPPILAVSLALIIGWFFMQDQFSEARGHFRTLVGGKQEAGRVTLAHQVYAAYRRYDSAQLLLLMQRAQTYHPDIKDAAREFDIDPDLLQGIAAAESSFLPRNSADGGRGLFQITKVPKTVVEQAGKHLAEHQLSLLNPRHNTFLAAATLKYYLAQMNDDLFLGLLAYNIGPANGGLKFIMQQYGATDFFTIQPYLQQLPRDYPIRVLSYSLAFRLWQKEGKLLAYEEGKNARHIQNIGIPGLLTDF
ncbi:transglycosylase SLT domain-containing protein [Methylobacter psychrophilus]|uniref:transglycosylase SLT domain-containing protein n=1 Tax=Methylobacter psychrophilus TaxID=96941 RepID=UPI0021D4F543|nr:transglycosylase SLT domain-containing protein [Methylobacter psychrophilus]